MPAKTETIAARAWPDFSRARARPARPRRQPRGLAPVPAALKRGQDVVGAILALMLFGLPMLLVALAVRLDSPGPALFRQRRVGLHNREFPMLKFRTMHDGACDPRGGAQTVPGDPRLTGLGGFLRRTSLDELPQLFNVLRGDMSLVGPRPHAPNTCAAGRLFADVMADYPLRHVVKPGITGLAQVRGLRGETRTEEALIRRVESDFDYIARASLALDLLILLRTAICVLRMKNAY